MILLRHLLSEIGNSISMVTVLVAHGTRQRICGRRQPPPDRLYDNADMLAVARAEERNRIRRELHDLLGPTIAAATMRAEVARGQLVDGQPAVMVLLAQLLDDLRRAVDDVRGFARELEPLDLGAAGALAAALRREAHRIEEASAGRLCVRVDAPDRQHLLPPAVDLAARRVAAEALTNTARHSRGRHCSIRLQMLGARELCMEIRDDGIGLPACAPPGLGLRSMVTRVRELDGTIIILRNRPTGTRVVVRLPLDR